MSRLTKAEKELLREKAAGDKNRIKHQRLRFKVQIKKGK